MVTVGRQVQRIKGKNAKVSALYLTFSLVKLYKGIRASITSVTVEGLPIGIQRDEGSEPSVPWGSIPPSFSSPQHSRSKVPTQVPLEHGMKCL